MMRSRVLSAAVVLATFAGVAACGGDDDEPAASGPVDSGTVTVEETEASGPTATSATTETSPPSSEGSEGGTPEVGGEMTMFVIGEMATLDTKICAELLGPAADRAFALYGRLLDIRPGESEIRPALAESMTSDDAVTWTLKLREGVTFTDGTPFDAEAVKFNVERHLDPAFGSRGRQAASAIASMTVVDPTTLEIVLKEPQGEYPQLFTRQAGCIGSPTAIREMGDGFGANPVTAGPFMLDSWTRDSSLVLVRNPDYVDAPKPYLDKLTFNVVVDPDLRWQALESESGPAAMTTTRGVDFRDARDRGWLVFNRANGPQFYGFNHQRPPFDDRRVREAFLLASDVADFNTTVRDGAMTQTGGFFDESSPYYDPTLVQSGETDLARAQQLIDEYVAETGGPLEIVILDHTSNADAQEYFLTQWSTQLDNVEITGEVLQTAEVVDKLFTREDYQVAGFGRVFDSVTEFYSFFSCEGPFNTNNICVPELDEAVATARSTLDEAERQQAVTRIQEILLDEVAFIYLYMNNTGIIVNDDTVAFSTWSGNVPIWEEVGLTA